MKINAHIENSEGQHHVKLTTDGNSHAITIPHTLRAGVPIQLSNIEIETS